MDRLSISLPNSPRWKFSHTPNFVYWKEHFRTRQLLSTGKNLGGFPAPAATRPLPKPSDPQNINTIRSKFCWCHPTEKMTDPKIPVAKWSNRRNDHFTLKIGERTIARTDTRPHGHLPVCSAILSIVYCTKTVLVVFSMSVCFVLCLQRFVC